MELESLLGRIGDVDAHEQIPPDQYGAVFGERGQRFYETNTAMFDRLRSLFPDAENQPIPGQRDDGEINLQAVWTKKGYRAPSSADLDRRPAVLDAMGIRRQLIFPTMGLFALTQSLGGGFNGFAVADEAAKKIGREALDAYNDWAGGITKKHSDRLRVVGMLSSAQQGLTIEGLLKATEALIATGVKGISIVTGQPPAGLSPAHPAMDDFYALLVQKNVALVIHPPSGSGFRATDVWGIYPGCPGDVSFATALHASEENFLTVMIMGGVLERHPDLRVGIIENGASWLGPLAERLDIAATPNSDLVRAAGRLSLKPSEYLARQVRMSVLLHEPVELWIERYPMLQDCYCYSSDFPHLEGGQWSLRNFYQRIKPLGDEIVEKFFVKNSQLLLQ